MEEYDMFWTQTARDRRALEEELRQELERARLEIDRASDENLPAVRERYAAAIKAYNRGPTGGVTLLTASPARATARRPDTGGSVSS